MKIYTVPIHYDVNVKGTENVIKACNSNGVSKLVFTSSTNVMMKWNGTTIEDVKNANESAPYSVDSPCSPYGQTKMIAEQRVLEANTKKGLLTCALRPPGILGPRDKLVETVVKENGLPLGLMGFMGKQDWIYVENLVHAHFLAEKHLSPDSTVGGQAFFVTNGETGYIGGDNLYIAVAKALFRDHFNTSYDILRIPMSLLFLLANLIDKFHNLTRGRFIRGPFSKLTPITIHYVTVDLKFDDSKARKLLGYHEIYTLPQGIARMGIYNNGN